MATTNRRVGGGWLDRRGEGRGLPVRSVLRLQQTIGNRAVWRLLEPPAPEPAALAPATWRMRALGIGRLGAAAWRRRFAR
jgi:hypothetical protein